MHIGILNRPTLMLGLLLSLATGTHLAVAQPSSTNDSAKADEGPRFTVTPYGTIWTNMAYESSRTNTGDYVFFVFSPDQEGEPAFNADAKSTRLGVNVTGPALCSGDCTTAMKVEIDFQGTLVTENKPGVLLRHAYWEIKSPRFRLLAGQTWDVISPLNPGTLSYTVGWGGGNIGYRRMQLRGEYTTPAAPVRITMQGSLNADIVSDFATSTTIKGDHAEYPVFQGRIALGLGEGSSAPATIGVSGHYGEQVFDFPPANAGFDKKLPTWSINVDGRIDLKGFGLRGEWFRGENVGAYLGGILQGVCPCKEEGVQSTGGWASAYVDLTPRVRANAGFGIDDVVEEDFEEIGKRTYNQFVFGNITAKILPEFLVGFEITHWRTEFKEMEPGEAVHANLVAKYSL